MLELFRSVDRLAGDSPTRPALRDDRGQLGYGALAAAVGALAGRLPARARSIAVSGRAGASWVVADLAVTLRRARVVPVPSFFSTAQVHHVLRDAAVDLVLCCDGRARGIDTSGLPVLPVDAHARVADERSALRYTGGAERVIYTSGTTGAPKGVVHRDRQLAHAVRTIGDAVGATATDRHLSALPPSLLLEQIAGVLIPLTRGAAVHVSGHAIECALAGDLTPLMHAFTEVRPTTTVLVPQQLSALTAALRAGVWRAPDGLRFAAVGGAPVPAELVNEARAAGLPVIRGYGLSECASVVAVERPDRPSPGNACGPALPGIEVTVDDGEIVVRGPTVMTGYLGHEPLAEPVWRTGDTGGLDADGSLHVHGRRDRLIVLPSGRNLQPEWIEAALTADPRVVSARAGLAGDGRLEARCIVPAAAEAWLAACSGVELRDAIAATLAQLPVHARPVRVRLENAAGTRSRQFDDLCHATDSRPETFHVQERAFHACLLAHTADAREQFMSIPIIATAVARGVSRATYLRYLEQAYHHVRHTCPLLGAALARCTADDGNYREALLDYLDEERGHERWILDDIAALGGDAEAVRRGEPGDAVRVMVGYAYHAVERTSPYALLGMVHVLESLSAALAGRAAGAIRDALGGSARGGFSYLESHGALDREHVRNFEGLVDTIEDRVHQRAIVDTARITYRLYGDVFRELEGPCTAEQDAA